MNQPYSNLPQNQPTASTQFIYSPLSDESYSMGRVLIVVLWILIGLSALTEVFGFGLQMSLNGLDPATAVEDLPSNWADLGYNVFNFLSQLANLTMMLCFALWGYRLIATVKQLGAAGLRRQPHDAWVYFIVPLFQYFEPYCVYSEIWRACTPDVDPENPGRWRRAPAPGLVVAWWTLLLCSLVPSLLYVVAIIDAKTWHTYSQGVWLNLFNIVLDAGLCYLVIRMVTGFAERIDARLDRLRELADERQISVSGLIAALHNTHTALHGATRGSRRLPPRRQSLSTPPAFIPPAAGPPGYLPPGEHQAPAVLPAYRPLPPFQDKLLSEKWLCAGLHVLYFIAAYSVTLRPDPLWMAVRDKGEPLFLTTLWTVFCLFVLYRGLWHGSALEKWVGAALFAGLTVLLLLRTGSLNADWQMPTILLYYAFAVPGLWAVTLFVRDALALGRHEAGGSDTS